MLGLGASLAKGGASLLTYVKDNLKLYLDFKSNRSDTLAFPSEGSTSFNGSSDYIAVPHNDSLNFGTGNMSVCAWINRASENTNDIIVAKKGSNELGWYFRVHSNDKIFLQVSDGTTDWYDYSSDTIPTGEWVHVCSTWNQSNGYAKFYINGIDSTPVLSTANITGTTNNTSELRIGRDNDGYNTDWFHGSIANLAMWTRELEPEEIQSIMNKSYSQLKGVEKTSLVSWWALNSQSNGLVESATGEVLSSDVKSFHSITGTGNNYTNNILEFVADGYAFFNISGIAQGKLYRFTYTVLTQTASGMGHSGGSSAFTGSIPTTVGSHVQYLVSGSANMIVMRSSGFRGTITDIVLQEVSMTGVVTGATTTTSVYGGNAPILPRAIDIAESFADAIGNGSASFNGSSDYIQTPSIPVTTATGSFSAWVKNSADDGEGVFTFGDANADSYFSISIGDNGTGLISNELVTISRTVTGTNSRAGFATTGSGRNILVDGNWHHVAVTGDGSEYKIYIDGVSQSINATSGSGNNGAWSNVTGVDEFYIGKYRANGTDAVPFQGNIAHLGLWAGALTQAQIQSVMESTSYAKIPASVKSTLGSEKIGDPSFEDASYWTILLGNGGVDVNTTNAGKLTVANAHETRLSKTGILENGKLYKLDFVVDSLASGRIRGLTGFTNIFNPVVGTNTEYFIASSTDFAIHFDKHGIPSNTNATLTMTDISIKEVTNDIVAYYPLDADNSANGVTNDVTTGETLGSNTFVGLNQWVPKITDREIVSVSGDEITLTIPTASDAGMTTNNLANLGLSTSLGYAVGDLVKFQFKGKIITNGSGFGATLRFYEHQNYVFTLTDISLTSEYQTFIFYGKITNLGYSIPYLLRMASRTGTDVYKFKNFSVQKVTSNTGVLK
jgi:hypothetical protein